MHTIRFLEMQISRFFSNNRVLNLATRSLNGPPQKPGFWTFGGFGASFKAILAGIMIDMVVSFSWTYPLMMIAIGGHHQEYQS